MKYKINQRAMNVLSAGKYIIYDTLNLIKNTSFCSFLATNSRESLCKEVESPQAQGPKL